MKLLVIDHGDHSAGILPSTFVIDCPFEKEETTQEELDSFKNTIADVYAGYMQGKWVVLYDDELDDAEKWNKKR